MVFKSYIRRVFKNPARQETSKYAIFGRNLKNRALGGSSAARSARISGTGIARAKREGFRPSCPMGAGIARAKREGLAASYSSREARDRQFPCMIVITESAIQNHRAILQSPPIGKVISLARELTITVILN